MESLAYLHLALAYEEPANIEPVPDLENLIFEGLNWRKLSYSAWVYWLSAGMALTVLGMATQALAALEFGVSGSEVAALQQRLQKLGYFKTDVTGYFGPITKDAVVRFQKDKGLRANGIVGPETEEALIDRNKPASPPASKGTEDFLGQGDRGQTVSALQESLKAAGFYNGSRNGVFDAQTEAAVRAFQKAKGLAIDGIVGPQTRAALPVVRAASGQRSNTQRLNIAQSSTSPALRLGDRGTDVANLQVRLANLGYYRGLINGIFDQETKDAVIKFQLDRKLPSYGLAGPMTFAALEKMTDQASVQALQRRLRERNFYTGPVDGVFNAQTRAAIAAAQEAYGVSPDDIMNRRF